MNDIKNALPVPTYCDCCGSVNVIFTTNDKIYGRKYGEWSYIYYCEDCKAAVGCHPNTKIPLGRMADRRTRTMRGKVHKVFDVIWKSGYMNRTQAYLWLSDQLGIPPDDCHISWLNYDKLDLAVEVCKEKIVEIDKIVERRRKKKNAKQQKRKERLKRKINRSKGRT